MTFLASWRLVLLLGPAVLLVAYVLMQRTRQRTVVRFTTVDMLESIAPNRPGWQRHIPAAALLAALAVLVVGFAEPARAIRTPRQRATVVLTLDISGSMVASDVAPSRLAAAEHAARTFVGALPAGVQLGLVTFSTSAAVLVAPTTDRSTILAAIDSLQPGGGTATGDAIQLALNAIAGLPAGAGNTAAPAAIVLMSDGSPTIGRGDQSPDRAVVSAAAAAKQANVPINTIAFGTQSGAITVDGQVIAVPSDPAAMAQIASSTGGRTFTAATESELTTVYRQIGRVVGFDVHRRPIAAWFVGIALMAAMIAAVAALIWNQRLV